MQHEPVRARTDLIIWGSSGLLAVVLGLGSAFVLWMALRQTAATQVLTAGIVALGIGLLLIGLATPRALPRVFLVVFAVSLVAGFVLGSPSFAHLSS